MAAVVKTHQKDITKAYYCASCEKYRAESTPGRLGTINITDDSGAEAEAKAFNATLQTIVESDGSICDAKLRKAGKPLNGLGLAVSALELAVGALAAGAL